MSDGTEKKKKGKGLIIILILVIVIMLGASGYLGYLYYFKSKDASAGSNEPKVKVVEKSPEKVMELEEFLVNLSDEGGNTFLKVKMVIAYPEKNKELDKEITGSTPQVRDIINTTLRKKTSDEFKGDGLDKVKQELIDKLNVLLMNGKVTNIYFNEIIIQG